MSKSSIASNGFLSSITSLFNGTSSDSRSSSLSNTGYLERKRSAFGSGLPSSMRRGPPVSLNEGGGAWDLPYSQYTRKQPDSAAASDGQYPPSSMTPTTPSFSGYESSTALHSAGNGADQSSSTLVPAQGRPSMTLSSNVSIPSTAYPPLKHTWKRIRTWCESHYSELADTLNWPATEAQLDDLEMAIGFALPPAVRDSYLCYDGQEVESNNSCSDGLFFGLPLLSLEQVADEWRFWRSVDEDASSGANAEVKGWMSSCPSGWIRAEYSCRGWIPLITDHVGNYVGVDLTPNAGGGGSPGQVILFGRDFDTKIVLWRGEGEGGWGRFLQYVAEELEGGEMWTLEDNNSTDSNDEEDAIGYESYFSNGGAGASKGGGDRGGDGGVGFKLRGEYKGWPVLEAWADRSMRCWDEVGMSVGQPAWQADPPSVLVNQDGESLDAEGSTPRVQPQSPLLEQSHPLEETSATVTTAAPALSNTLSPPLPSSKAARSKQKRKEDSSWPSDGSPVIAQARPRKPAPAPAAPLDLPTIDDVRAAHAAAMAMQRKSGTYHYDVERGRPPAGMGGMGMGMGMASTTTAPHYSSRYAHRQTPAKDVHIHMTSRDEDGLELENRSSTDGLNPSNRNSSMSTLDDGSADQAGRSNGRTLYSPSANETDTTVENLIDATSAADLTGGEQRSSADVGTPTTAHTSEPFISSPLATHSPVFSSIQEAQDRDRSSAPTVAASVSS